MRNFNSIIRIAILACFGAALAPGCSQAPASRPAVITPAPMAAANSIPEIPPRTATETALPPSPTPVPSTVLTPVPSPTVAGIPITATVYTAQPRVPVLAYHQFARDWAPASKATKVRLADFRQELEDLYNSGFSMIPLDAWLRGDLRAPSGRRPFIFTMDDLFYNNQIALTPQGDPSTITGIGVLWQFYQEHPDFGFSLALFPALGEKLYGNPDDPHWKDELARAVVWCIEHNAIPYNHTFTHARLDMTSSGDITWEMAQNDKYLRGLLTLAGRPDLLDRLDNIFALPYGMWPVNWKGKQALLGYKTPEGWPLLAVMEIDTIDGAKYLPPPYTPGFDPMHTPRIVASQRAIQDLVDHKTEFPSASACRLGPLNPAYASNPALLSDLVSQAVQSGACPPGLYAFSGLVLEAGIEHVSQVYP